MQCSCVKCHLMMCPESGLRTERGSNQPAPLRSVRKVILAPIATFPKIDHSTSQYFYHHLITTFLNHVFLGTKHFLLICNVKGDDSGEIKFVAKNVESTANLEVEGLYVKSNTHYKTKACHPLWWLVADAMTFQTVLKCVQPDISHLECPDK